MNKFRNIVSVFLLFFVLFVSVLAVYAEEMMTFELESKNIKAGEEFEVAFSVSNNPGIAGFTMKINFDKSVLTPVLFKNTSKFTALTTIDSSNVDLNNIDTINITYDSVGNIYDNGVLGKLTFIAKKDIGVKSTVISWENDDFSSAYNQNLEDVVFTRKDSVLTFNKYIYGDANANNRLTAEDASIILQKVLDSNYKMPIENKTSDYMKYIDVDLDDVVCVADASLVLQKVLNKNIEIPVKQEDCLAEKVTTAAISNFE